MFVVGIDENGLGPVLGPLIVTGSLFRCSERRELGPKTADFFPLRIRDSKRVFSQRNKAHGERAVFAMAALLQRELPGTCRDFLNRFTLQGEEGLRKGCPREGEEICWHGDPILPLWSGNPPDPEALGVGRHKLRQALMNQGLELVDVKSEVCCVRDFNALLMERGRSKAGVNFTLFERVIRYFHEQYDTDILFLCGKNMATMRYEAFFGYLEQFPLISKEESPAASVYRFDGLGEVRFLVDGEEASLPIAVSSLFGKYLREVFMERQNAFFAQRIPDLPRFSGYRDRVTKEALRRIGDPTETLGVPGECFLRQK